MNRTLTQTIDNTILNVGIGIISGDIVAFLIGLANNSLVKLRWYTGIGVFGLILILIAESRIYQGVLIK